MVSSRNIIIKFIPVILYVAGITGIMAESGEPVTIGTLNINGYWVRASSGPNTAAYLTVTPGGQPDQLIKVECAEANTVELHNHIDEKGVMKMRPVSSVSINNESVVFKPGGLHIMLMGLKESFKDKSIISLTLHFETAGAVEVNFPVRKIG